MLVALHEGFADPVALLHLGLDLRFAVRDELFEWPMYGVGELNNAKAYLDQIIAKKGSSAMFDFTIGHILFMRANQSDAPDALLAACVENYRSAVEKHEKYRRAWQGLGQAFYL